MHGVKTFPLFTLGHSTRPWPEFLTLLRENAVGCLVDVRRLPGSRAFPAYDQLRLRRALHDAGIAYVWARALGGRRGRTLPAEDARNAWWENASFRQYADYATGRAFARALTRLERRATRTRCVLMCAEAVWWRCHRRIIADHLLARGHVVFHIMGSGKTVAAELTAGACCEAECVIYPAAAPAHEK